jgi:hypothetical protein
MSKKSGHGWTTLSPCAWQTPRDAVKEIERLRKFGKENMSDKIVGMLQVIFVLGLFVMGFGGCGALSRNVPSAIHSAQVAGFSDVQVTATHIFFTGFRGCDEKDSVVYDATATNVRGEKVSLIICGGFWKANTIRSK